MAASTYYDQVQQLYIAYFGRPADPVGLAYWAANIDAANGSVAGIVAGFSASNESQALYAGTTTAQKVSSIYLALFNRSPEAAGLAYWVAQIDSGAASQAQAAYTIQSSAGAGDATAVANKLAAAKAFTAQIDTTAEIAGYSGTTAAAAARTFLSSVDATAASLATATAAATLANTVAAVTHTTAPPAGQTFVLTDATLHDGATFTAVDDSAVQVVGAQDLSTSTAANGGLIL